MQKVNKHTVLKAARDNGSWSGYIAGNKVNEYHITGGWGLGCGVEIKAMEIDGTLEYVVNGEQTLPQYISAFLYYQEPELGRSVSFWAED